MKSPYRVLIADDDPGMLSIVVRALQLHHYECDTAPDATQARHLLTTKNYDLLISDLDMPGNEDLRLIRDLPQIVAGLPVILVTGYPTMESALQSLQLPVAAYLPKPCKIAELLHQVELAVESYRAFRAIRLSQERTEKLNLDLAAVGARIQKVRATDATPWQTLMELTLQNIHASLQDFQTFTEVVMHRQRKQENLQPAPATGPLLLVNALRETISVLEGTKGSFKSKELGELRKKLTVLLNGN